MDLQQQSLEQLPPSPESIEPAVKDSDEPLDTEQRTESDAEASTRTQKNLEQYDAWKDSAQEIKLQHRQELSSKITEIKNREDIDDKEKADLVDVARIDHWDGLTHAWLGKDSSEPVTIQEVQQKLQDMKDNPQLGETEKIFLLLGTGKSNSLESAIQQVDRIMGEMEASVEGFWQSFGDSITPDQRELLAEQIDFKFVISYFLEGKKPDSSLVPATEAETPTAIPESSAPPANPDAVSKQREGAPETPSDPKWKEAAAKAGGFLKLFDTLQDMGLDIVDFLGDDAWIRLIFNMPGYGGGYSGINRMRGMEKPQEEKEKKTINTLKQVFDKPEVESLFFHDLFDLPEGGELYTSDNMDTVKTKLEEILESDDKQKIVDFKEHFSETIGKCHEKDSAVSELRKEDINLTESVVALILLKFEKKTDQAERKAKRQ